MSMSFVKSNDQQIDKYPNINMMKKDYRAPKGAWASGNYTNTCRTCDKQFLGDKRALQCGPCAYSDIDAVTE